MGRHSTPLANCVYHHFPSWKGDMLWTRGSEAARGQGCHKLGRGTRKKEVNEMQI